MQSTGVKRKHASVSEPQLIAYDMELNFLSNLVTDQRDGHGPQRDSISLSNTSYSTLSETMTTSMVSSPSRPASASSKFIKRARQHVNHRRNTSNVTKSSNDQNILSQSGFMFSKN